MFLETPYHFDKTELPPPPLPAKKPTCDTLPSHTKSDDKSNDLLSGGSTHGGDDTDNAIEMPLDFDKTKLPPPPPLPAKKTTCDTNPYDTNVSNSDERSDLPCGSGHVDDVTMSSALVESDARDAIERVVDEEAIIQNNTGMYFVE